MGPPALAAGLSLRARQVLSHLMTTGQSEDHGVAEMLNTIAENGDDMASDAMLRTSAQNIIHAAQFVLRQTQPPTRPSKHPRG